MREHESDFHKRFEAECADDDIRLLRTCASLQALENITHEINDVVYNMRMDSATLEDVKEIFKKAIQIYGNDETFILLDLLKRHGDNLKGIAIILSDLVEESENINDSMRDKENTQYKDYCDHHQLIIEQCYAELRRVLIAREKKGRNEYE